MNRRNFVKSCVLANAILPAVYSAEKNPLDEELFNKKEYKYNEDYKEDFARMAKLGYRNGQKIISHFSKYYWPESVVDYGCGIGAWLKVYSEWGVKKIKGYDLYTPVDKLWIPEECFGRLNLEKKEETGAVKEKYDLAICVETIEHLHKEFADDVINMLTRTSDVILFSGALPYQVGHHHHNCRPPKYWADKFAKHGYLCFDILRYPLMQEDSTIDWWYNQSILVFCKEEKADIFTSQGFVPTDNPIMFYSKYCVDVIIKACRQFRQLPR